MKIKNKRLTRDMLYVNSVKANSIVATKIVYSNDSDFLRFEDIYGDEAIRLVIMDKDYISPEPRESFVGKTQEEILKLMGFESLVFGISPRGVILPVYRYSHSGDAFSTTSFGDPWDSWKSGFVCFFREDFEARGIDAETAKKCCEEYVEAFSNYNSGSIYEKQEIIIDGDGEELTGVEYILTDRCWDADDEYLDDKEYSDVDEILDKYGDAAGLCMVGSEVRTIESVINEFDDKSKAYWVGFEDACNLLGRPKLVQDIYKIIRKAGK